MIDVEHISKKYGKQTILKDVTFSVKPGECVAVVGRNGCGKSTLMQILAGILKPDGGTLRYFDRNPLSEKKVFRSMCGYVPQENPLIEELSVLDNLKLFGADKKAVQSELLRTFELEPMLKTPVCKLSGGMKRRVSIACAVYYLPSILFMDEPTTALDIYYKNSIHEWMKAYRQMNGTVIMTTHAEDEIRMADKCFVMREGTLDVF
jgi:ABC-type multidrug transport system ATPase subunit